MNKELIERNYQSIVARGLIFPTTNGFKFVEKLKEEVNELGDAVQTIKDTNTISNKYYDHMKEELADVILVALNMAKHFNIDVEKELINKIEINEARAGYTYGEDSPSH